MAEACCICRKYLPNDFFPLYHRYYNDIHQPCRDCWNELNDEDKKRLVEQLDKVIQAIDDARMSAENEEYPLQENQIVPRPLANIAKRKQTVVDNDTHR